MPTEHDIQAINITLDWHRIPLRVPRVDEPIYREAANLLNSTFRTYQKRFPQESPEKLWVYTALQVACELKRDTREKSIQPVMEKIEEMDAEILKLLQ